MVRMLPSPAFLSAIAAAFLASSGSALAAEASPAASIALPVCLVGLGAADGSPAWSELDVTPSRSVDLDLADGAGLTVACGTLAPPNERQAARTAPARNADPSVKGDFGSL